VCWNIIQMSLWLLCKVHFVQSTQRTPPTDNTIRAWHKQFTENGFLQAESIHVTRVSQKLEYRSDVCRVTSGAHIEHL